MLEDTFHGQRQFYLNGHDSWNDGACDTDGSTIVVKPFEGRCLEKQLGNDEVGSCKKKVGVSLDLAQWS